MSLFIIRARVYNYRMSKRGICILNAYDILPGAEHFYERMSQELNRLGIALEKKTNAEVFSYLDNQGNLVGEKLAADFILYLDKDLYASYGLENRGYRLFNKARSIELCDDKMRTHMALANHGIRMPKTISGPLNYSTNSSPAFVREVERLLSYPLVAKENFGSLGAKVYLLKSHEELVDFENVHRYAPRLYQEFIASSLGMDYRIIVVGGRFVAGMKRVNRQGDFRSNVALGGAGEKVKIPAEFIAMAEKAASLLGLDYCGADVLIGPKGEPILCEVNSNAFIEGIEKVTGINVAAVYAHHIQQSLEEK
jgi:gamma-F420-2:alpha-L-glutamate ligase